MDPNQTLLDILATFDSTFDAEKADEVVEKLQSLAEWIHNGGFYPKAEFVELSKQTMKKVYRIG